MIPKLFLLVSYLSLLWMAIRFMRRWKIPSLLVFHTIVFATVFDFGTFFLEPLLERMLYVKNSYDPVIHYRMLMGLSCINLIAIAYIALLDSVFRSKPEHKARYEAAPIVPPFQAIPFCCGLALLGICAAFYLNTAKATMTFAGIWDVLGDYSGYYLFRHELNQMSVSGTVNYALSLWIQILLPLLTLYSLQKMICGKQKIWIAAWALLLVAWLASSMVTLQKAPILIALLCNIFGAALGLLSRGVRLRRVVYFAVAALSSLIFLAGFIYLLLGASTDLGTALYILYERIVEMPVATSYNHYLVFPEMHPHTHYTYSNTLNLFLGLGRQVDTGGFNSWEVASLYSTGYVYNMNTGFLGSGWAEMGFLGIIQGGLIIYGLFFLWDAVCVILGLKHMHYILAAYFFGRFTNIHNADLMYLLTAGGLILAPIFCFLLCFVPGRKVVPVRQASGKELAPDLAHGSAQPT